MRKRWFVLLGLAVLALAAAMATPLPQAAGSPASQPYEVDEFPNSFAQVEIQTPMGPDIVLLRGPTSVKVDLGSLAGDVVETIDTEIVSMELTGFSPLLLSDVIIRVPQAPHPGVKSVGKIEENENVEPGRLDLPGGDPPFCGDPPPPNCVGKTASSFFDVFFEVVSSPYLPPSIKLHNHDPKRLEATITHKPPATGETYEDPTVIPLFFEDESPSGVTVGPVFHTPRAGPVGGIVELLVDSSDAPASASEGGGASPPYAAIAGIAAACGLALAAGGWYARRRLS